MAGTGYIYNGKLWRACPTKADTNSFFHSAFGTRDREGEELSDKQAHFRRMRWATFLTYFASEKMPYGLTDVLRKCFSASNKYKLASVDDKGSLLTKYISDVIASERNVTTEEIPILATLENIRIVVVSSTQPDAAITVKPNPDILGSYPNVEKAKEEVVLCLERDTFSRLELVKDYSTSNETITDLKIGKEKLVQPKTGTIRYKKGGSAGSKGVRYQVNLLTIVLLNAFKDLREWRLSTENEGAGKFDDIVLEETEGATFIQSKHKENKRKRITLDELTSTNSKNNDFSLPKYFLSYLQIKGNFNIKNVILCTNADGHERVLKLLDRHEACSESILHFEKGRYSFYTLKNEMLPSLKESIKNYYQENFKNKSIKESEINDENLKDFQQHLQLYLNYPSLNSMETIIDASLSLIRSCQNSRGKIYSSEIVQKVTDWFQQEEGTYLTQTHASAMFTEIWREKYFKELEEYKVFFHTDDLNFQPPTQIFHVVTNGGYLLQVIKIYHAIRGDKTKTLFLNIHDDIDIQKQVIETFMLSQYTFLIIIWPQTTKESEVIEKFRELKEILEKSTYKKIIVVAEDKDRFIQRIGWDRDVVRFSRPVTFEDLHPLSQERLLKRKNIVFQGEKVSLKEILEVHEIEYYGRALNTELLENLIKGEEIKVGSELSELDEYISSYYISRAFKRKLDKALDENWNNGEKKEIFLNGARSSVKDSTLHSKSSKLDEELCDEVGDTYSDDMKQEEILSEENIYNVKEKVVIISDSAGTGKSTVLAKLAVIIKKSYPSLWVIRIELNDCTKYLRESLRSGKQTINITELLNSANATKLKNHLEEFLFSANQKVVLLLDGVDEISPDYTGLVLGLLKQCQEETNFTKILVTTRPHMMKELEQVSKVKPFFLQPFTEQNQNNFLVGYWENGLQLKDEEKCKRYADALIRKWKNLDNHGGNSFTTVPLQLRMIAEIFQEHATSNKSGSWKGCKEYVMGSEVQPNISERMNITDLYRMFVEKKQHVFAERANPTGNTVASGSIKETFDKCLDYHRILALEVILGKEKLHLFSCYQRADESMETQILKIGIVQKTKEEIHFSHRTFADYFVAECLFSELQQNRTLEFQIFLIDTIFVRPQYNVTCIFFDSFLRESKNSLSPNTFKEYQCFKHESSMEFYKLQSHLLHLLAEGNCMAIFVLILKCIDFKVVSGKEINILNFYTTRLNKDNYKNILGNTLHLLQILTKEAGINIKDEENRTPLHYATKKGYLEMAKFLVQAGADINSKNNLGKNPLHLASENGNLDTVKYLIELGIDYHIRDNDGFTALHTATYFSQLDIVKFLTEHGGNTCAVINNGSTLLHLASKNGHLGTVKYIFELGADLHIRKNNGFTALQTATYFGHLEIVKFLIERGSDINVVSNKGSTLLHSACEKGNLDTVKYLFELGIDYHIRNNDGFTALHMATYFGHLDVVKFLIDRGSNINVVTNNGSTLLHLASENGHLDTMKYIFKYGIYTHIKKNNGFTALQTATYFGYLEIVKYLTRHGSDINVVSNKGSTLLHSACENGNLDTVKYLFELGIDCHIRDNYGFTIMHTAACFGQLEIVIFLMEHGFDINVVSNNGSTLLHLASENGHFDTTKYIYELGIDLHIRKNNGFTALQTATYFGHLDVVKFLIDRGSDINVVSNKGSTLLHSACENGNLDTVKYLFELDMDYHIRDNDGFTALQKATYFGQLDIVKFLTERDSNIHVVSNEGSTLLHSACENGHLEIIKYLLEIGVDISIRDCHGFTVLEAVTQCGDFKTLKFLVESGLDINISSNNGYTLLHLAGANGHMDAIKYFLELGMDLNIRDNHGFVSFHLVNGKDQLEIVKSFIGYGQDINIKSADGFTLLHLTSADGRVEMVKFLLENDADFLLRDNDGFTPLHLAAAWGQLDAVKLLVEYGLSYNATTNDGRTPLHLSCEKGHSDIVKYFLELGVDWNVRDDSGRTALHLAVLADHLDVVKLLVEHGGDLNVEDNGGHTALHFAVDIGRSDTIDILMETETD